MKLITNQQDINRFEMSDFSLCVNTRLSDGHNSHTKKGLVRLLLLLFLWLQNVSLCEYN